MQISHTEIVNAPLETVWEALVLKIEQPQFFVPNVSNVVILEKTEEFVIRQMTLQAGEIQMELVEKITNSPYLVTFEIVSHLKNKGYILNEAIPLDEKTTQLTYTMCWQDKETLLSSNNLEILKAAVKLSKEVIENQFYKLL